MDLRSFARKILADPLYRQSVIDRAQNGTLPPEVEEMIWSVADSRVPLRVDDRPANGKKRRGFVTAEGRSVLNEIDRRLADKPPADANRFRLAVARKNLNDALQGPEPLES